MKFVLLREEPLFQKKISREFYFQAFSSLIGVPVEKSRKLIYLKFENFFCAVSKCIAEKWFFSDLKNFTGFKMDQKLSEKKLTHDIEIKIQSQKRRKFFFVNDGVFN